MSRRELESIEHNLDAELSVARSSHPADPMDVYAAFDPADPLASDPTDVERYEVELSGLRDAVVGMERLEDDQGSA